MRILIAEDQLRFAQALERALDAAGFADVKAVGSGERALDELRTLGADVLVTDVRMPGMSGLDLLSEVRRVRPGTDVIVMTAFADVSTAREALKKGALDYLVKPFDNSELVGLLRQAEARRAAAGIGSAEAPAVFAGIVGASEPMKRLFASIERVARTEASVLVLGESGTGKELVARAVHDLSDRRQGPFVDIHCAAIPETLLESELFGHERGAFTGAQQRKAGRVESAEGGTLFLDEIGEMPLSLQPKLLRFLQERRFYRVGGTEALSVDVRVVAATNRDLAAEVKAGRFREDLYYRLDVMALTLPRLRERPSDIPRLLDHFLSGHGASSAACPLDVRENLARYGWPGNVREMQNVVERMLIESGGGTVTLDHLPEKMRKAQPAEEAEDEQGLDLRANERELIEQALERAGGNKTKAAELLGISRRRLYSRMERLKMDLQ